MRQALIAAILGAGLMAFSAPSLADSRTDKNHHHHDHFQADHNVEHKAHLKHRAIQKYRAEHRKQAIKHRNYHRLQHNKWKARQHYKHHRYGYRNHYHKRRYYAQHHHYNHWHRDSDYLEWLGMMILLDEALDNDYR